jgi:hypothetical protein
MLQTYSHLEELAYNGVELRPHFILSQFRIEGSAFVTFTGPCSVATDDLVDWEDRLVNDYIRAKSMVHFLGEFFGASMKEALWMQRLLVSLAHAWLQRHGVNVTRSGDDLYFVAKKLSVSVVTVSPVSALLHLGINIDPEGAPVNAGGLKELGVDPVKLANDMLVEFQQEYESIAKAAVKVRAVI